MAPVAPDQAPGSDTEGSAGPGGQVAVTSQLTQAYRTATPFSAGPVVATTFDRAANSSELFVLGTAGEVFHVAADPDSDTGWSSTDLHFPGPATLLAAETSADGTRVVFAVTSTSVLYMYKLGGQGRAVWQQYPVGDWSLSATGTIRALKAGHDELGRVVPAVMIEWSDSTHPLTYTLLSFLAPEVQATPGPPGGDLSRLVDTEGVWQASSLPHGLSDIAWTPGPFIYNRLPDVHPLSFSAYPGLIFTTNQRSLLLDVWDLDPQSPNDVVRVARNDETAFSLLSAALGPNGPQLTGVDDFFNVYSLDYDSTGQNVGTVAITPTLLALGPAMTALVTRVTAGNDLDVFILGADHLLYQFTAPHLILPGQPALEPVPLSADAFVSVVPGSDPAAFSEAFAVTAANTIVHFRRESADADWQIEPVDVASATTIEPVKAYAVQVLVNDANAVPAMQVPVTITSPSPVDADINGQTYFLDADRPWTGTTNSAGVVLVSMTSNALSVPVLSLTTAILPEVIVDIDPCAGIQHTLAAATGPDLTAATVRNSDGTTRPLLAGASADDLNNLVTALNDTMSIGSSTVASTRAPGHPAFHPLNDARVASVGPAGDPRPVRLIDVSAQIPRQFSVDLRNGVVHRTLTQAEHTQVLADLASTPALDSSWSWSDLFNAVTDGLASIAGFVVDVATTVVNAVSAVIQVVIDGVTYVFDAIVSSAEQLLDLVQETFAKVKVAFDDLCGWLGNIFNWDAILRTKSMIVSMVDVLLEFTEKVVEVLADKIHDEIVAYDAKIDPAFAALMAQYGGGNDSLGQIRAAQPAVPTQGAADAHDAMGVNIAHHALVNAFDGPAPVASAGSATLFMAGPAATFDPATPIGTAITAINTAAAQFQSSPSLISAQARADGLSGNPATLLNRAVGSVLEILRELAHAALAGADALVRALAAALEDAIAAMRLQLNLPLPHIPLLSDLYQDFVGTPLTVLDCYALVVAIPATAVHTIVYGVAPFPDQASLDAFTTQLTADALIQRTGLAPAATRTQTAAPVPVARAAAALADDDPPPRPEDGWTTAARVFMTIGLFNSFCFIAVDAFLDYYPPEPPEGEPPVNDETSTWTGVVGGLGYASSLVGALAGMPWWYSSGPPGAGSADEFSRVLWIFQLAPIAVDTVTMIWSKQLARMDGMIGSYVTEGFGVVNLALTITWVVMDLAEGTKDLFAPAGALFGAAPGAAKILHSYAVAAATDGISLGFLVYFDLVCDTLAFGGSLGSTIITWSDPVSSPPPHTQRTTRLASLALTAGPSISLAGPVRATSVEPGSTASPDAGSAPRHHHLDVRVDDQTYRAIQSAAAQSGGSVSDLLRTAIRQYLLTH